MSVLAVIPARGGSKGAKNKNLRPIAGRSLVARAVEAASGAPCIEHVLVSTDSEAIAAAAIAAGAEAPFLRPAELATDKATVMAALQHAVGMFENLRGVEIEVIAIVEPTSPFRCAAHVEAAVARFRAGGCASVATVCPLERKPQNIFTKTSDNALRPYIDAPREFYANRQEMAHLCRVNSAVYVTSHHALMARGELLPAPVGYVEMSAIESTNIDEEIDFALAELVAGQRPDLGRRI